MTVEQAWEATVIPTVEDRSHAATRWARRALLPQSTVVLGTKTTDLRGAVCEIGVIDTQARILLNIVVNPRQEIAPEATRIHHLTDEMVVGAPTFAQVLPDLLSVTAGRTVAAYNSNFDFEVITREGRRYGMDLEHLEEPASWRCISQARSDWLGHPDHYLPLGAGHRALDDCVAALTTLRAIAASRDAIADGPTR